MASRLKLQEYLETLTNNVYYQPPVNTKMKYPCIRYTRSDTDTIYADDDPYRHVYSYEIVVIDLRPDSPIAEAVSKMRMCRQSRPPVVVDGLYQETFKVFW